MEARSVDVIPIGKEWQYEPKWDGFRCLLTRDADAVTMYSKSGQDLRRYFPELAAAALQLSDVAGPVIESPGLAFGPKHRHATFAFDIVLLFVGIRMPVQFAKCTWLKLDQGRGDRL